MTAHAGITGNEAAADPSGLYASHYECDDGQPSSILAAGPYMGSTPA